MSRFLLDQIDELEERFRRARARGNWEEGAQTMLEAARVMLMLAGRTKDAAIARKRIAKADAWTEKARVIRERRGFAEPAMGEAAEGGPENGPDKDSDWLLTEKPDLSFDDIAGLEDAKEQIRVRMVYPFLNPELAAKYGVRKGGGILLYGPPGTGKTMLAKAVAAEIDAAFYTVRPSEIMSKWVGESEQNIRRLFAQARSNPASIVFIDEVEALLPPRSEDAPAVMKRLVPQILGELEGIDTDRKNPLLFVGATNEPWNIDPAFLRPGRFDEKIYVALPDAAARRQILAMNLEGKPLVDLDFEDLVARTGDFSGADLRNLCQKTANSVFLEAVRSGEDRDITMDDFRRSLEGLRPSVSPELRAKFDRFAQET